MAEIIHLPSQKRFVLPLEAGEAYVEYVERDGKMHLVYSEVPYDQRGKGIGRELVEKTFDFIQQQGKQAVTVCSYIRMISARSERWRDCIDCDQSGEE